MISSASEVSSASSSSPLILKSASAGCALAFLRAGAGDYGIEGQLLLVLRPRVDRRGRALRGRLVGTAIELAETLSAGYRRSLWRLHATPLLGATVTTQVDPRGRLAPLTFLSAKLAVSFGVLF